MPTTIVALLNHPIRPLSGIGWLRPMAPVVWCPARDGDQKLVGWRSALCNDCTAAASPDRPAGSPGRDTSLVAVICREEAGGGGDRTRGVPWRLGVALDRVTGVQGSGASWGTRSYSVGARVPGVAVGGVACASAGASVSCPSTKRFAGAVFLQQRRVLQRWLREAQPSFPIGESARGCRQRRSVSRAPPVISCNELIQPTGTDSRWWISLAGEMPAYRVTEGLRLGRQREKRRRMYWLPKQQ